MRPDVIIDPAKSIVVEIKAAEIVPNSDSYAADYTLRFPRFLSVRQDKDETSCMTLSEVHRMFREFKGKLFTKQADTNGTGSMSRIKKKPTGPRRATQAHLLHAIIGDMSVVKVETDLFKGQVFWVLRGDEQQTKPELEVLIKRFGGKQSQSDQMENAIIIAGLNGPDLFGLKKKGHRNIVLPTWIRDCVREQRLIPLNPKYMVFATKETEKQFRQIMDGFNDSYVEPLTMEGLQEILDKMPSRSEVVKRRRLKSAQERADKIKVKRLNNLEEQLDPSLFANSDIDVEEKETLLQLEIDNTDGVWELEDTERARKIAAELTRRYYGHEGEREPPLGMFQGLEVFIVYPPTPAEYLKSISSRQHPKKSSAALGKRVKREAGHEEYNDRTNGNIDGFQDLSNTVDLTSENIIDIMTKSIDIWTESREKGITELMEKLDSAKIAKKNDMDWTYFQEESTRRNNLDTMLTTLSQYQLCRNNLEMVTQILEFHGARVIPQEQCTIETCQSILRTRLGLESNNDSSKNTITFSDVGVPLEIVVLFDPLYLETLDQWKKAMLVSVLYGPNAKSFEVPRLVTSDWVKQSQKSEYKVPEEGYYPVE
ncbi:DNA ligase (ATP) [Entomortierella beljakovae]|nr:DNA ligase (ATP) [Entomortierella beljakovae]